MTRRWRRIGEIYRRFAKDWNADFSESAANEMFLHESRGLAVAPDNGYALGKKWMDVTVSMWREDLAIGLLARSELEADYPQWFLDRVLRT